MHFSELLKTPLYAESWNVAFREAPSGAILEDAKTSFTIIPNNLRYWAADPFIIHFEDKTYIFAELYDYIFRRGILGYCTIQNGKASKWNPIIRENYHLSYPCLMEHNGKVYMMPESSSGTVLTVYEAIQFPNKWEKRVLRKEVNFADTTPLPFVCRHLALTHRVDNPENPKLTLIDLDGELEDREILVKEALRSRPAGNCFAKDGETLRPAQISNDIGSGYGKGIVFCKSNISEDLVYSEEEIRVIYPEQLCFDRSIFLDGMHTYNCNNRYEVIDIKTRHFNVLNFVMRIVGKVLRS